MNNTFLSDLKQAIDNCISEVDSLRWMFCSNPGADFSRDRKISFADYCNFMIQMQSKSLPNEVMDFFGHTHDCPTASAFVQQKYKFLHAGWDYLFHLFVSKGYSLQNSTYHGYRLLACDGSDVNIARNPDDDETFIHEGENGYNAIHVNALYDLMNNTYCDFLVQGKKKLHERNALNAMADRYDSRTKTIILADRGYESFNVFAHMLRKELNFVIRMKDINSSGILSAYDLPDAEFDTHIRTTLTKRHTKETTANPDTYTILPAYTGFDYFDDSCRYYGIEFRIVRFMADDGKYISVATNLPEDGFPLEEIRSLYKMRWGEETSFRELKYTIGLVNWHSRKKEGILQELAARMILYNFCELATNHAAVQTRENTKHTYKVKYPTAELRGI